MNHSFLCTIFFYRSVTFEDTTHPSSESIGQGVSRVRSGRNVRSQKGASETGITKRQKQILVGIKFLFGVLLFLTVLTCNVLSKLSLVSLTEKLWIASHNISDQSTPSVLQASNTNKAVTVYWQLFLVVIIPQCVTFIRSFAFGVLGKSSRSFPWPSIVGTIVVSIVIIITFTSELLKCMCYYRHLQQSVFIPI